MAKKTKNTMTAMSDEKFIWDFLLEKIGNPYGAAGLIGNLYVESRLQSNYLEGRYARNLGITSSEYTEAVDRGTYKNFVRDSAGYGIAQWTYWSRKENLLEYATSHSLSIGDLKMQLDFLWQEIQTYKTCLQVLKNAKSVKEASDIVVERYERPADQTEKGKQNRANYGREFYDKYCGSEDKKADKKEVLVTFNKVNIRYGNGLGYAIVAQVAKDTILEWVATAENGWHAVVYKNQVGWISGEFSEVKQ